MKTKICRGCKKERPAVEFGAGLTSDLCEDHLNEDDFMDEEVQSQTQDYQESRYDEEL